MVIIGVLAFQGAFKEHIDIINSHFSPKFKAIEVRTIEELGICQGVILPGGESTAHRIIGSAEFWAHLRRLIENGMPIWGTCAGAILLCKHVYSKGSDIQDAGLLGVLDCSIIRNFYGSQLNSGIVKGRLLLNDAGKEEEYDMVLIRAPVFSDAKGVDIIARSNIGDILGVRHHNIIATSFHPELLTISPSKIHDYFLNSIICQQNE